MSGVRVAIMILELVKRYLSDPIIKDQLPEFNFVWSLAQLVKDQGCYCGMNNKIASITPQFNELVENLSPELVAKIGQVLNRQEVCFGIIKNNKFEMKCY